VAVDADLVDDIAAGVADVYREAESALVALIRRHLDAGLDSPAAERRLGGIRALRRGAQAIIAGLEADSSSTIREALADAYRHGWTSALADLPERWFARSGIGQAAREALRLIPGFGFVEALANALVVDVGQLHRNILRDTMDAFRSVQAAAAARILTGAQTRRQASQSAWQRLVDRGITGFTDKAGRRWRLSSYVEMAARTNAQRAATQAQADRLTSLGVDLVYVSDAVQECVLCRPFEARILRLTPGPLGEIQAEHGIIDDRMVTVDIVATLEGAMAEGLFHPNCRHSISAYLPGVTKLPPGPTEDPDGDKARQRQRALERRIRRHKERAQAALTPEAKAAAGARVRAAQADLRAHLAANPGLKRLPYREQIGAGNHPGSGGPEGGPAGDLGPPHEPTLDGGPAPAPARRTRRVDDREQQPVEDRQPGPGQGELEPPAPVRPDPVGMSDDELDAALLDAMNDPAFDEAWIERLSAEVDRRETEQRASRAEEEARADRVAQLLDEGWPEDEAIAEAYSLSVERVRRQRAIEDLRAQGFEGARFDELARQAYRDYVRRQWLAAENATNGYLVTNEGEAKGIDPISLFSGPEARARRWASDELKAWWDEHGRLSFAEFKEMLLTGGGADQGGRDFLT
jgi:hypothetical protein